MADPTNPAASAARKRPTSVTTSSNLLILFGVIQVIGLVVALSVLGGMREAYREAFAGTEMADQAETIALVSLVGTAGIGLLVAIGVVVLAMLNNRGKNPSRIVTWVLGGLFLCCAGAGLALSAGGNAIGMNQGNNANAPSQSEIQQALDAHLPGWYQPASTTLSVIGLLALLVALILLALPSSNEFFRRPQPAWQPPVPGSGYPGYPPSGGPGGQSGYQPPPGSPNPPSS